MKYVSVSEIAKKWGVSERSVRGYCADGKINGAFLTGKTWNIPENAEKPDRINKHTNTPKTLLEVLKAEKMAKLHGGIQRVKKGYCDWDVGDINCWFFNVFPDMLNEFGKMDSDKNVIGFPAIFLKDYYDSHSDEIGYSYEEFICFTKNDKLTEWQKRCYDDCQKRWLEGIIFEMERLFRESDDDYCSKGFDAREYQTECRKKAFSMLCKWLDCLWH